MKKKETGPLEELNNMIKLLSKHIKLVILSVIVTTLVMILGMDFVVKPKYQSTSEIIVNQKLGKNVQLSEQQQVQTVDLQLVNTYKSVLNSQMVSNAVKEKVGKEAYKGSTLDVSTDTSSQVISISVTSPSPKYAAKIANETAYVFKSKIKNIMNANNVSVISKASQNLNPVFPKKMLGIILGVFLGIILGGFLSLFKEINDNTVSDKEFIIEELSLVDLGTINDVNEKGINKKLKK